jgi:hypothetical protein
MITVEEYYDSLLSEIHLTADSSGSVVENEFLHYALEKLADYGEFDEFESIEDGRDATGLWRIDAISIDNNSEISTGAISLFISLFEKTPTPGSLSQAELDGLIKKLNKYVNFALNKDIYTFFEPGSGPFNAAFQLKEAWKPGATNLRLYVITNKPISNRLNLQKKIDIEGVNAELIVWDLNRFFQLELSGRERSPLIIDLSNRPIKALLASKEGDSTEIISMLAAIPATTLVDLYSQWGSRLLEQNVRSFLTAKVKVNKGIRETIKTSPKKFFAFNNGITATAESIESEQREDGEYITMLENFQIVNGGQTTASLFYAATKDKFDISEIYVPMKLSIVNPSDAVELVPFISRYANSQNKVTEADLFSNHPFHVKFEEFSRNTIAPPKLGLAPGTYWFYERARGQYTNAQASVGTKSDRTKFISINPRSQLITKTNLAKYLNSFNLLPYIVSKGAEFNFSKFAEYIVERWDESIESFNQGFYKTSIAKAIIFKNIEKLIADQKDSWYKGGQRDKLVPYTISFIENALQNANKEFNFDEIWKKQDTSAKLNDLMISIAEKVNALLQDPNRTVGDVSSYAKREAFWKIVKNESDDFDIDPYLDLFIDKKDLASQELKNKIDQKILIGKEMIEKVRSIEPREWEAIRDFFHENNQLNEDQATLIKQAIYKRQPLSERQCKSLYALYVEYNSYFRE